MSLDSFRLDNSPRMATGTNMAPFVVTDISKVWPHFAYEGVHKRDNPDYVPMWLSINSRNWRKVHAGQTAILYIPPDSWVVSKLVRVGASRTDRIVFQPVGSRQTFYTDGWRLWAVKRSDI